MKKVENGNVGTPGTLLPLIELSKSRQQSFRHAFDSFNTLNNPIADSFASQSFGLSKRLGLQEFTQGTQILQPQRVRLESTVVPNLELEWDFIEGFRSLGMNLDEAPAELPAPKTETRSRSIQKILVVAAPIQQATTRSTVNFEPRLAVGPDVELLSGPQVATVLGIGLSCFHKLRKTGRMPLPLRFCSAPRWRRRELLAWIDAGMPHNSSWKWEKQSLTKSQTHGNS